MVEEIDARKSWADSSKASKVKRDAIGSGGVSRVLWEITAGGGAVRVFDIPNAELIEMLNRGKQLNAQMLMAVVYGMMRVRNTKQPLLPHQTGRTHRKKPRGTRKRKNMGVRQLMNHFFRKDLWR